MSKSRQPHQILDAIYDKQRQMVQHYEATMRRLFPLGCRVRVNHHHGSYYGEVIGYDASSHRIRVQNVVSGKTSQPYPGMTVGWNTGLPCVERVRA